MGRGDCGADAWVGAPLPTSYVRLDRPCALCVALDTHFLFCPRPWLPLSLGPAAVWWTGLARTAPQARSSPVPRVGRTIRKGVARVSETSENMPFHAKHQVPATEVS